MMVFLSSILNFKFVSTFNCKIDKLDPALLRPGRLLYKAVFRYLNKTEAMNLTENCINKQKLVEEYFKDSKKISLAEYYNLGGHIFSNKTLDIGF